MMVGIKHGVLEEVKGLICDNVYSTMDAQTKSRMDDVLEATTQIWYGTVDDEIACIWGLIPPSFLSNQVYMWLYTTELVKDHTFLFVRYSQRAVEQILKEYEIIIGDCLVEARRSHRWLKWLGAEFGEADGKKIPFRIMRKAHG